MNYNALLIELVFGMLYDAISQFLPRSTLAGDKRIRFQEKNNYD